MRLDSSPSRLGSSSGESSNAGDRRSYRSSVGGLEGYRRTIPSDTSPRSDTFNRDLRRPTSKIIDNAPPRASSGPADIGRRSGQTGSSLRRDRDGDRDVGNLNEPLRLSNPRSKIVEGFKSDGDDRSDRRGSDGRQRSGDATRDLSRETNVAPRLKLSDDRAPELRRRSDDDRPPREIVRSLDRSDSVQQLREVNRLRLKKLDDLDDGSRQRLQEVVRDRHRHAAEEFAHSKSVRQFKGHDQFDLHRHGDVARRAKLWAALDARGGWRHRWHGPIVPWYRSHCISTWYFGPVWYPRSCWYPRWSVWVDWAWWYPCDPLFDPRPIWCRPVVVYRPCPVWAYWQYPVWTPLPMVSAGTWVDVPINPVPEVEVQLLAVRFVDPGHPEKNLGPRYRVWLRNNSRNTVEAPFNVLVMVAPSDRPAENLPQAGVRIDDPLRPEQVLAVDVRLPAEANRVQGAGEDAQAVYPFVHVLVDSHRELEDVLRENNGVVLPRHEVLPVDPAIFAVNPAAAESGQPATIAGEGLGPEPGKVIVNFNGLELEAEIEGWLDQGVRVRMPRLPLAAEAEATLAVVRGDGAISNVLPITLGPAEAPPKVNAVPNGQDGPPPLRLVPEEAVPDQGALPKE